MSLREKKYAYTRQVLFDAAMELFRQRGFEQVSVEEIADRAGFSRATFFNHFGSKDGILRCFAEQIRRRVEKLAADTENETNPMDRLRKLLMAVASDVEQNRDNVRIALVHSSRYLDCPAGPTSVGKTVIEITANLIATAQQSGLARRDMPAPELAGAVFALYGHALWSIVVKNCRAEPAVESAWQIILEGIRNHDPVAS